MTYVTIGYINKKSVYGCGLVSLSMTLNDPEKTIMRQKRTNWHWSRLCKCYEDRTWRRQCGSVISLHCTGLNDNGTKTKITFINENETETRERKQSKTEIQEYNFVSVRTSGGASYGAKGLKPPPPDFVQAPPRFLYKVMLCLNK